MDVIHDRAAGLDVHKDSIVACVRTMSGNKPARECRTYGVRFKVMRSKVRIWKRMGI